MKKYMNQAISIRLLCTLSILRWGSRKTALLAILCSLVFCTAPVAASAQVNNGKIYKRIISLYSAHTENLVSMGAADQLIGISPSDNFPANILDKPRFSYREDPERFIAANPDLILVRPMIERSYPQLVAKLREAGIAVVSLQPTTVDEIFDYWRELGRLSGRQKNAEDMIEHFRAGIEAIGAYVSRIPQEERPWVYFESMHRKMKTFAPSSIALFALEQAGGRNVAADAGQIRNTNIAAYSKERILSHAAKIDIFIAQKGRMNPVDIDTIRNETGFRAIKAVKENRIVLIDEHLVSRPTLRLLEGIMQLYGHLYPLEVALSGDKP